MSKFACQYAIIRFAPFVETGEFANVGILLIAPERNIFAYRLETKRTKRVTDFFEKLDGRAYRQALHSLDGELKRIRSTTQQGSSDTGMLRQLFAEVTRTRESIIRFSEPRVVLADDPNTKLDALFSYYVERDFVTKQSAEALLEKAIQAILSEFKLDRRFHRQQVGDDTYHAPFPFVETINERPVKAIKPLFLGQDSPSKLIEHAGAWRIRLDELKRRKTLPDEVLFAVSGPDSSDERCHVAYQESILRLQDEGAHVIEHTDHQGLLTFAS